MPFGNAKYGATIFGFTNASSCVITVNSTQFFQVGGIVRVADLVCTTAGNQLNGDYTVTNLTSNTVTINQDTTSYGTYISGGFLSILQSLNPNPTNNAPSNQANFYQPLTPWTVFNQARGGGTIPLT